MNDVPRPSATSIPGLLSVFVIFHANREALALLERDPKLFLKGKRKMRRCLRELLGRYVTLQSVGIELPQEGMTLAFDVPKSVYWELEVPMPDVLVIQSEMEMELLEAMQRAFGMSMEVRRCVTLFARYKKL